MTLQPGAYIGRPMRRREDLALITGRGRYVDDLRADGLGYAVFVRSPFAHALINSIRTDIATGNHHDVEVFVAGDLGLSDVPPVGMHAAGIHLPDVFARPPLAKDRVRFVGEAVAVVIASDPAVAVDAAGDVGVEYDVLDPVVDPLSALDAGAPLPYPDHGSNVAYEVELGSVPASLGDYPVVVRGVFRNQRVAPLPMEPGGILARCVGDDDLELVVSTQIPSGVRSTVARALDMDQDRIRVIAPSVGGGFGGKAITYPEHVVVAAVARKLKRPVKWVQTRRENLMTMTHGRGQHQTVELGATVDGRIGYLRIEVVAEAGAYPVMGALLPLLSGRLASGVYDIPHVSFRARSVVTNTTPTFAYRGAGRPEATALLERAMDLLARQVDIDPAEVRRRNLIAATSFPYSTPTGAEYDSGDYGKALDLLLKECDYRGWREAQQERTESGSSLRLGIGLAVYVEVSGSGPLSEHAIVRIASDGSADVGTGTADHGQGHATVFSQIAADALLIPPARIRLQSGDTEISPVGAGTFAARSVQLAGTAVLVACRGIVERARGVAARIIEASANDVELRDDGTFGVVGSLFPSVTWGEVAATADEMGSPLEEDAKFDQASVTYPSGAHAAIVEVDTETGSVRLIAYAAVDDGGTVINPLLAAGQIHGGVAQGAGQALFERVAYDANSQPMTTNLVTYHIPGAEDLPNINGTFFETPSPLNHLGSKGLGESGTVGAVAAIQNAVIDAVAHLGVRHIDMPLTPHAIWDAIRRESVASTR